jgi:hypothetical protein
MKWLALLLLLPFLLVAGAIALNRPPLFDPPGVLRRLETYLTTNVAQTAPDHRQPELRTRLYPMDIAELRQATAAAMRELGWKDIRTQGDAIRGVAVTPLLRFRDDVTVHLAAAPGGGTRMDARSASRVGRGDLAANERHLLDLFARLDQRAMAQKSPRPLVPKSDSDACFPRRHYPQSSIRPPACRRIPACGSAGTGARSHAESDRARTRRPHPSPARTDRACRRGAPASALRTNASGSWQRCA